MKKYILLLSALMVISLSSCSVHSGSSGKVPPGQAKKATGSKSAKPYAPGQRKKG